MLTSRCGALLIVFLMLALAACGGEGEAADRGAQDGAGGDAAGVKLNPAERDAIRARVAAEYAEERFELAQVWLDKLLDDDASVTDLRWGATLLMRRSIADTKLDSQALQAQAKALIERALPMAPQDPRLAFVAGVLAEFALEFKVAVQAFEQVTLKLPDEPLGWLKLGTAYENIEDRLDAAETALRLVRTLDLPREAPLRYTATHRLSRLLIFTGREDEGVKLADENTALAAEYLARTGTKYDPPDDIDLNFGALAALDWPTPRGLAAGVAAAAQPLGFDELATLQLRAYTGLHAADLDDDGLVDLIGVDGARLELLWQAAPGRFTPPSSQNSVVGGALKLLRVLDVDNDGRRELAVLRSVPSDAGDTTELALLRLSEGRGALAPAQTAGLPVPARATLAVADLDADGDVDLLTAHPDGRLLFLSGDADGGFVDRSAEAGLDAWSAEQLWIEDLDGDNDLDILTLDGDRLRAIDNRRGLRFADAGELGVPPGDRVHLADVDHDGRVDLLTEREGVLHVGRRQPDGNYVDQVLGTTTRPGARWEPIDLDQDGHLDLLAEATAESDTPGLAWMRGPLVPGTQGLAWAPIDGLSAQTDWLSVHADTGWLVADLLGQTPSSPEDAAIEKANLGQPRAPRATLSDGRLELLVREGETLRILQATKVAPGVGVELAGITDNALGAGALVQWRSGTFSASQRARGERLVLGLPPGAALDILRVVWPNGIASHHFDLTAGSGLIAEQPHRLGGSCPFLYTFDGERFVFVSDVLGATPLGLPFAPGQMVPFDHEEAIKIDGALMQPVDGELRLAITEELREVTYLDLARLRVIDHPTSAELQPDEGFVLPPFPPPGEHLLDALIAPARAVANRADSPSGGVADFGASDRGPTASDTAHAETTPLAKVASRETLVNGMPLSPIEDVSAEVAALDEDVARPFAPLPLQFQGLTNPWSLDLEFGDTPEQRAAIAAAPRLRLVLTGWLQWGDASVNLAAAEHPRYSYELPRLWRPAPGGGWESLPAPIGFPAGKTKTLVVDVTDFLDRDDPRLRLTTTLELSWDRIALDLGAGDAPTLSTTLHPTAAQLEFRGLSQILETGRDDQPERFDWDTLDDTPMWDQHAGMFTRHGDVLPLLRAIDDEFVILGAGDVVHLSFDASELPPLPKGWTRDYLLDLDGWAKDGDPNTLAGQTVEPLPFHGMSAYPPAPGDVEPEREAWKREWNTRAARSLMPRLASGR